jgi:hypothetical protein
MLSYLDPVLFPDECEVLEMGFGNFVYPIFKNGSSSLRAENPVIITDKKIRAIADITVYLREPFERYVSGVQTYLRHNPHLDRATALTMIDEYLFLNRHFALQFHWLINLKRYYDGRLTFKSIDELGNITENTWNALERDQTLIEYFQSNTKLQFYLELDKFLLKYIGQTVKFSHILAELRIENPALYKETIQRSKDLCVVLG